MKKPPLHILWIFVLSAGVSAGGLSLRESVESPADFPLVVDGSAAGIWVDETEAEVVRIAADLLAHDIERVSGVKVGREGEAAPARAVAVVAGTLGKSALIDRLAAEGKLGEAAHIKDRWETTSWQLVDHPFPGLDRALVIVGSDRRGTAYGLLRISETIGVSPWYWWAGVPTPRRAKLIVNVPDSQMDAPAVRYRGIFINDEDWGLHQWAKRTFELEVGSIGPKTYEKVFELMLRLRLNYIWPAMHEVSEAFHDRPENIELAHRYGIVAGASHCEPMLFNNANWKERERGKWNYATNRDTIHSVWEEQAATRGENEAVWGLGIRGIHDKGMQGPKEAAARIATLNEVMRDQRNLIEKHVTKRWGPVAQAFVPYKEVLPLYDAGLAVPDDVTLVWVDDNFGYIRRLGKPAERKRAGGAGVYWHLSYYGSPHSYLWINSTAPALMWTELHKAWENDARTLWVINVGDIKPMEIGMDYFARFSWAPEAFGPDSQPRFLHAFAAEHFGVERARPIVDLLMEFYRLGTVRKPELMVRRWAVSLPDDRAAELFRDYAGLLKAEDAVAASVPAEARDAYFELVGFPARVLGASGLIFLADRAVRRGEDVSQNQGEITRLREYLDDQVRHYNEGVAGGKWRHIMPGSETERQFPTHDLMSWSSQVRWPWGEKPDDASRVAVDAPEAPRAWRDAASADRRSPAAGPGWLDVAGLGQTGRAVALKPAGLSGFWKEDDGAAPTLEYDFEMRGVTAATGDELLIEFLPAFRLFPGARLRVAVIFDELAPVIVEVPGSSGREDENGPNRKEGVQNNFVRARVPVPALSAGRHTLRIRAIDAGAVIDRLSLPAGQQ
jgi:hypothetical protein